MSLARAIALADELDRRSYYEILGVDPKCSSQEIETSYYRLAPQLHPDRFVRRASAAQLRALTRISARLTEARRVLSTPRQRVKYDEGLKGGVLRLQDDDTSGFEDLRDPHTPVARKLFDTAIALAEIGNRRQALAKLRLARGFESDSVAIASTIARLEAEERSRSPEKPAAAASQTEAAERPAAPTRNRPTTAPPEQLPSARRHPRIPLSTQVALKLSDWKSFETLFTRNLSLGGVFLKTDQPLPIGLMVDLRFALPDGTTFELPGRVARRVAPGGRQEAGIGVQFLEMPAATRRHCEELLARIADRPHPSDTRPPPMDESDDSPPRELTLGWVVQELLRVRRCQPREALGLGAGLELDRALIEQAYADLSAPLGRGMLEAHDQNLISAIAELTAHLRYSSDLLLEELESETAAPAVIHSAATRAAPTSSRESSVVMELRTVEETGPRRIPAPLPARPVLAPQSLADLGPRGVAASEDSTLAERIFELIAEGHYEAAIELIARLVPNQAPARLIAARHVARGYLAEQKGDRDAARVEFESALLADRTSCEAIIELRKGQ